MATNGRVFRVNSAEKLLDSDKPTEKDAQISLWMRMGVTFMVSPEDAEKLLSGDSEALEAAIRSKKSWSFDGDSYIPDIIVEELCEKLGLDHEKYKGEVNFDIVDVQEGEIMSGKGMNHKNMEHKHKGDKDCASNPNQERLQFAIEQLKKHDIEHVVKNEASGHLHCRRKSDDKLMQYWAGTGRIMGSDAKGVHNLIKLLTECA